MKRNNVAKRFGIASLCLATAISAFSGIASFTNDSIAVAEGTTLSVADLVTVSEGATPAQDLDTASGANAQGLRISSNVAYKATFNTIFNKNSQFKFRFPETYDSTLGYYGDFKFHIADATDPNNCFDIVYFARGTNETGVYVQWGDEERTTQISNHTGSGSSTYVTSKDDTSGMYYAPAFLSTTRSSGAAGTSVGTLSLVWNSGVLGVQINSLYKTNTYTRSIARFDGTYDSTASKSGFTGGSKMGLPKLSFPNGYTVTVSSDFTVDGVDDHGTDVVFTKILTDGATKSSTNANEFDFIAAGNAYENKTTAASSQTAFTLNSASTTEFTSQFVDAYAALKANMATGDVLLGWKDAEGALYPSSTVYAKTDISGYTPVVLGFDTMKGASVRIDPTGDASGADKSGSGIRFMTLFDKADYAAAAAYIQSQGTLIAYTTSLTKGDFTFTNYATEIAAAETIAQVQNTKSKMFNYNVATNRVDDENGQPAYSMALAGITDYTQSYSARGYLEVVYADGSTQYVYTDYNEADNARSIAEVAWTLQQTADYQYYTAAQKTVVDDYAVGYVPPVNQE